VDFDAVPFEFSRRHVRRWDDERPENDGQRKLKDCNLTDWKTTDNVSGYMENDKLENDCIT